MEEKDNNIVLEKGYDHIKTENEWYDTWVEKKLFEPEKDSKKPSFSMILPPANVTGVLHMGHALTFSIPDIINRRKKMQGYNVLWLPGVDHAGIATQMVVERNLIKEQGLSKEDLGREEFLNEVWDWKNKSEKTIVTQLKKLGLSLDWSRMKFTLSEEMQHVVAKTFVSLYKEGKIYQGIYMVNRCPSCSTVLSDLEVEHKELKGSLTYIKYPVSDKGGANKKLKFIVVATTRPETMLGDMAIAVHPDDPKYKDIIGKEVLIPLTDRTIPVIADEHVEKEFGTGAVKVTPSHDPNDYEIALRHNLRQMVIINEKAVMVGNIPEKYKGLDRFICRKALVKDLSENNFIEKVEEYTHNVGHCQRCETIIEPNISKQWFLKTKEIAKPAIEVVEKKEIKFIPEKWEKVYFNWMYNIQDWCISRQLWWGHRIPAYVCQDCGLLMVEIEHPGKCSKCDSAKLIQDPDVLDTWFSSALWPFSTLGWDNDSDDFKTFYPTSIMATGFDIIFFWVARMVMMGIHFGKDIPFKEVFINGLIRDDKGQKMSKTKNNVIDPLNIIDEYGADALRFTLAIQAVPGMDIALSISRIKGYKGFLNKIWNASRYILMNLKGDETDNYEISDISNTDKWILHSMNKTIEKVNKLIDDYRINDAADSLYHFFWHEYCDWYLEFSKNDINNVGTRSVVLYSLKTMIKLMHPFIPYITEEIYNKVGDGKELLLQTEYPEFKAKLVFLDEYRNIELLKKIIMETRKTRTENGLDPNLRINTFLRYGIEKEKEVIEPLLPYFNFLTKAAETKIVSNFESLPKGFRGVSQNWEILLPIDNVDNLKNEINRLSKELIKLDSIIERNESKLSNEGFVSKAPESVILKFKTTLQESIEKKNKIKNTIGDLS